jgi:hypothetical protein
MTTPSRHEKARQMAAAFGEMMATVMALVNFIEKMQGQINIVETEENKEWLAAMKHVSGEQERAFKKALEPYTNRIKAIEKVIRDSAPKPPGSIITPDDPEFETPN